MPSLRSKYLQLLGEKQHWEHQIAPKSNNVTRKRTATAASDGDSGDSSRVAKVARSDSRARKTPGLQCNRMVIGNQMPLKQTSNRIRTHANTKSACPLKGETARRRLFSSYSSEPKQHLVKTIPNENSQLKVDRYFASLEALELPGAFPCTNGGTSDKQELKFGAQATRSSPACAASPRKHVVSLCDVPAITLRSAESNDVPKVASAASVPLSQISSLDTKDNAFSGPKLTSAAELSHDAEPQEYLNRDLVKKLASWEAIECQVTSACPTILMQPLSEKICQPHSSVILASEILLPSHTLSSEILPSEILSSETLSAATIEGSKQQLKISGTEPTADSAVPLEPPLDIMSLEIEFLASVPSAAGPVLENSSTNSEMPVDFAINEEECTSDSDFQGLQDLHDKGSRVESEKASIDATDSNNTPPQLVGQSRRSKERLTNSRKRSCNPSMWKRNIAKRSNDSGQEHFNVKNQLKPARNMKPGCGINCRFKCHSRVSRGDRCHVFEKYWGLQSKVRQWEFINQFTSVEMPKERSKKFGIKQKELSRKYHLKTLDGRVEKVCQTMFIQTLDISFKVVRTANNKKVSSNGLTTSPDKRGLHSKQDQSEVDKKQATVDEHIRLFEAVPSHFCRKDSKRKYLEPGLSISKMFNMYKIWMDKTKPKVPKASERTYRDYFCTKFNYGFHMPRKDQCDLCNVYVRCNANQKAQLQPKFDEHLKNKDLARKLKAEDKDAALKDTKICFAIFDLQKVLLCPKDDSSILYYKRKLSCYNLTIYDGSRKEGRCYVWHEGEGKRGANEISSCLEDFVSQMCEKYQISEFRFWSDNCGGQNKNKFLFALYSLLSQKFNVKIIHRYLQTGHTQNEADSVHACIERAAKQNNIFEPSEWYSIIAAAKQSEKPYKVIQMSGKFKNLHTLANKHQKWTGHKEVNWKDIREIILYPEESGKVSVRHSLCEKTTPTFISVTLPSRGRPINLTAYNLPRAYRGALKLKESKLTDLASLCVSGIIPTNYLQFYVTLSGFRDAFKKLGGVIPARQNLADIPIEIHPENVESDNEEEQLDADDPDTDIEDWYDQTKDK